MAIISPPTAPTAGARKARIGWPSGSNSLEAARHRMKTFDSHVRDQHHLSGLHTGVSVVCDHVRLNHYGLSRTERVMRHRTGGTTRAAKNRGQVTATIAV